MVVISPHLVSFHDPSVPGRGRGGMALTFCYYRLCADLRRTNVLTRLCPLLVSGVSCSLCYALLSFSVCYYLPFCSAFFSPLFRWFVSPFIHVINIPTNNFGVMFFPSFFSFMSFFLSTSFRLPIFCCFIL